MQMAIANWVSGFTRYIDHTTSSAARLWAIGDGLKLAKDLHITYPNMVLGFNAQSQGNKE